MIFSGLRALVVEDEGSIALMLEDMLGALGCEIEASVPRPAQACTVATTGSFDFAILDLNRAGELGFPLAYILRQRRTAAADIAFTQFNGWAHKRSC